MKDQRTVFLSLASFRMWVAGAYHVYATLRWFDADNGTHKIEVKRPLTAEEIRVRNTELVADGLSPSLEVGATTISFPDDESATEVAIEAWRSLPEAQVLLLGHIAVYGPLPIVASKLNDRDVALLERIRKRHDQLMAANEDDLSLEAADRWYAEMDKAMSRAVQEG